jgi:hypothetical protein
MRHPLRTLLVTAVAALALPALAAAAPTGTSGATVLARSGHALRQLRTESHHRRAPGTIELSGTVLAQSATLLELRVDGFPSGLAIRLGTAPIPSLASGTPVEVRVSLGPDPASSAGVVLTLAAIHVEDHAVRARNDDGDHGHHDHSGHGRSGDDGNDDD